MKKKNKIIDEVCDEKKYKIQLENSEPKRKIWMDWIQVFLSIVTVTITFGGLFCAIPAAINNTISNKQTQVIIEPRDGDIIVKDGDDYKLLQLIKTSDIVFPNVVQERQYRYDQTQKNRCDINNKNNEDWSKRDAFEYVIDSFTINPNKVINLLSNITNITVYCDFYEEKDISTSITPENEFLFTVFDGKEEDIELTYNNVSSDSVYVTKELNDGIEWVKIRVKIQYEIDSRTITDEIVSDWIETKADLFA